MYFGSADGMDSVITQSVLLVQINHFGSTVLRATSVEMRYFRVAWRMMNTLRSIP